MAYISLLRSATRRMHKEDGVPNEELIMDVAKRRE
jgi:hypothetical protein